MGVRVFAHSYLSCAVHGGRSKTETWIVCLVEILAECVIDSTLLIQVVPNTVLTILPLESFKIQLAREYACFSLLTPYGRLSFEVLSSLEIVTE